MEVFAVLASVQSMGLTGIQGYPVTVEAYCVDGMPMFEIVGLPDAAVKESRERVRAAMSACHTPFPVARLTLNLAPADVRKEGPAYDLPIALAILSAMGRLPGEAMEGMAAVGELSLSGSVMGVRGALSMAIAAKENGLRAIMLPASNAAEAACIEGLDILPVAHLSDAIAHLSGRKKIEPLRARPYAELLGERRMVCDFADVRKEGPAYDLPIALAILASMGRLDAETMAGMAAVGELSLSGGVMGVRGALSMAIAAKESGLRAIMLPASNAAEAACIEGLDVLPVAHLSEAIDHLRGRRKIEPLRARPYAELLGEKKILCDFADVRGQKGAKRALEIAAAGGHNVLMIGPPGSGKTMMARCLPGILPDMTLEEALEVTRIHSAAGTLAADAGLMAERPFRAPHHTVSAVALVGGGTKARPGEISLAHNGVLFLDELPEYDRGALEALRQPLEDGFVSVVRVSAQAKYPARAMFVAAMNPCPCGNYGSSTQPCRCTQKEIARYLGRISGPLLDRIDMQLEVTAVPVRQITESAPEEPSEAIHARVQAARRRQQARYAGEGVSSNAELSARQLEQFCPLDDACRELIGKACDKYNLSMRAVSRVRKVARTIADLAGEENIGKAHILEALRYRNLEGNYWK